MADGIGNLSHMNLLSISSRDTNSSYPFNRPNIFASSSESHSFTSRKPAANALPSFQLPLPPFHLPGQPSQQPVPPFQQQIPTPPIDPSDYIGSRVAVNNGISQLPSGSSSGFNNSCFPSSQAGIGFISPNISGPLSANPSSKPTSSTPGAQSALMQPNYGRPPYSPTTPGYQSSQSPDGLTHHSYDGVGSPFSLPARGRGGDHSSLHSLQNPILSSHTQGAQPPTPTTTASSDSFARPSSSSYYQTTPATSHPLSYPGFTSSAPSHSSGTTGTYSRGIPAYSPQSQNHSVPSSPMQAPYSARSFSSSFTLPTMAGPVLSNMSNPGGQMALVGGISAMPHGYHPGHPLGQHAMYPTSQHNTHSDRPFKCDTCPASFNRNHDLKRHTRIHLAIKPYPCGFCDKSFSRKDALKRHRLVKGCGNGKNDSNDRNGSLAPEDIKPEED